MIPFFFLNNNLIYLLDTHTIIQASETMSETTPPTAVLNTVVEELRGFHHRATERQVKRKLYYLAKHLDEIVEMSRQQVDAGARAYQLGKASDHTPGVVNPIPFGSVYEKSLEPLVNDFINKLNKVEREIINKKVHDYLVSILENCKWDLHVQAVSVSNSFKQGRRACLYERGPFSRAEE